jgi:PhnB protein
MPTDWKPANKPTLVTVLPGGRRLVDFMRKVFEAGPVHIYETDTGAVARAEIRVGESMIMTGDPFGGPGTPPGSSLIYVADCDAAYQRALAAGATSRQAPADQFYGDRTAYVVDPFGNQWSIATHKEDVTAEEMTRRAEAQGRR